MTQPIYIVILKGNDGWFFEGEVTADNAIEAITTAYERTSGLSIENVEHATAFVKDRLPIEQPPQSTREPKKESLFSNWSLTVLRNQPKRFSRVLTRYMTGAN